MADIISKIPDKLFSLQVKLYVNAAIFSLRISKETSVRWRSIEIF